RSPTSCGARRAFPSSPRATSPDLATGPAARAGGRPREALRLREELAVAAQVERPALAAGDAVADMLPALPVAVEAAMLELDPGALGRLGDEAHLPLARLLRIALELPLRADQPAHEQAVRRLVGEDARETALAAVDAAVVQVAADPWLEHGLGDVDPAEQVVVARLEAAEPGREDVEGALDRRVDDDRRAHVRVGGSGRLG